MDVWDGDLTDRRVGSGPGGGPVAPTRNEAPRWLPLVIVGALVLGATALAPVLLGLGRAEPGDLVDAVVEDMARWDGAIYRGSVDDPDGRIDYELTVTAAGARGTLTRDGGRARAEIVQDRTGVLIKADRAWWERDHAERAAQLADTWVADPFTETGPVEPILGLHPGALSTQVGSAPERLWTQVGEDVVDGRRAVVVSDGSRRLVVSEDEPHELLSVDLRPGVRQVRVAPVSPAQAADAAGAGPRIRATGSPRTLTQWLLQRPRVDIQLRPEALCVARTCAVEVTVTNTGEVTAQGRLEITADGNLVATEPMHLEPGESADFTGTTENSLYNVPGARGEVYWEARAFEG